MQLWKLQTVWRAGKSPGSQMVRSRFNGFCKHEKQLVLLEDTASQVLFMVFWMWEQSSHASAQCVYMCVCGGGSETISKRGGFPSRSPTQVLHPTIRPPCPHSSTRPGHLLDPNSQIRPLCSQTTDIRFIRGAKPSLRRAGGPRTVRDHKRSEVYRCVWSVCAGWGADTPAGSVLTVLKTTMVVILKPNVQRKRPIRRREPGLTVPDWTLGQCVVCRRRKTWRHRVKRNEWVPTHVIFSYRQSIYVDLFLYLFDKYLLFTHSVAMSFVQLLYKDVKRGNNFFYSFYICVYTSVEL